MGFPQDYRDEQDLEDADDDADILFDDDCLSDQGLQSGADGDYDLDCDSHDE